MSNEAQQLDPHPPQAPESPVYHHTQVPIGFPPHPTTHGGHVAMITGESPRHPLQTHGGNNSMEKEMRLRGIKYEPVIGSYGAPENSFIVHNPDEHVLKDMAKRYGQESVLFSKNGYHRLVYTNGPNAGMMNVGAGQRLYSPGNIPTDFYTMLPHGHAFSYELDWNNLLPEGSAHPIEEADRQHALTSSLGSLQAI